MTAESGELVGVAVEVEAGDVLRRHFGELDEGGVGGDVGGVAVRAPPSVGVGGSDIGVAVGQSLNQPGCLEIHEDRPVVRGAAGLQHAHHAQLDRVGAGNVKHVFRVRHEAVAGRELQASAAVSAPSTQSPNSSSCSPRAMRSPRKAK